MDAQDAVVDTVVHHPKDADPRPSRVCIHILDDLEVPIWCGFCHFTVDRSHAVTVGTEVSDLSVGDFDCWLVGETGRRGVVVVFVAKHGRRGARRV